MSDVVLYLGTVNHLTGLLDSFWILGLIIKVAERLIEEIVKNY
jgi:hypothetical protein